LAVLATGSHKVHETKEEETVKRALLSLAVVGLTFGLAGCGEKQKEPTAKDVGKAIGGAIKEGKEAAKEAKQAVDKAVKDAK
jgi:ribosomal protein S5